MALSGVMVADKPQDWTSHDVVAKLRRLLGERRIGHGGTLDPMATGVLPVFVGRATRGAELCESADKEYLTALRPGIVTDTQDITGTVLRRTDTRLTREELEAALEHFRGKIAQIPPMYSAVKVGGKKLYELARKGQEVEREARNIEIFSLTVEDQRDGDYYLRVVCSKGTYIRTLVNDIGEYLSCGAAMSYLRRTRAGSFTLTDAHTLEEVAEAVEKGEAERLLTPIDRLFRDLGELTVSAEEEARVRCGASFRKDGAEGRYRVYGENGEFLMVGVLENGLLRTEKNFFEVRP